MEQSLGQTVVQNLLEFVYEKLLCRGDMHQR
jgi:hypothetical protein